VGGGLLVSKAARDADLVIANLRNELQGVLSDAWDTLDVQKKDALRVAREIVNHSIGNQIDAISDLESTAYLDVSALLDRLEIFGHSHTIRRVLGASQYYIDSGYHQITIESNFLDPLNRNYKVYFGDASVPDEWSSKLGGNAYSVLLTVPASALAPYFKERELNYVDMIIVAGVPKLFGQRTIHMSTKIALFPKYPVKYEMRQVVKVKVVGNTEEHQKGPLVPVPPHSNANVCTDVPEGSIPLRVAYERTQGTEFLKWFSAPAKTDTGFCWGISNNGDTAGMASFDVIYLPLVESVDTRLMFLRTTVDGNKLEIEKYLRYEMPYIADFHPDMVDFELKLIDFMGRVAVVTVANGAKGYEVSPLASAQGYKSLTITPNKPW
jgi:hypothetical protein